MLRMVILLHLFAHVHNNSVKTHYSRHKKPSSNLWSYYAHKINAPLQLRKRDEWVVTSEVSIFFNRLIDTHIKMRNLPSTSPRLLPSLHVLLPIFYANAPIPHPAVSNAAFNPVLNMEYINVAYNHWSSNLKDVCWYFLQEAPIPSGSSANSLRSPKSPLRGFTSWIPPIIKALPLLTWVKYSAAIKNGRISCNLTHARITSKLSSRLNNRNDSRPLWPFIFL